MCSVFQGSRHSNTGHICEGNAQYPNGNCSSITDCATCNLTPGCVLCNGTTSCVTSMDTECAAQVTPHFDSTFRMTQQKSPI